jgi:6-phosphogluconolactonase
LKPNLRIFTTPHDLAKGFAEELLRMITESTIINRTFTIALSGGSTPEILFNVLSSDYAGSVPWQHVHVFWSDERCVAPDDPQSNYGMARRTLLSKIEIPDINIHRIKGEDNPEEEVLRYSFEISHNTRTWNGRPVFDLVLLGLGEDGHTASIFPGHPELLESDKTCDVTYHPVTFQKRITLTGMVINNADVITFLVTGRKKEAVVEKLFKKDPYSLNYPAAYIVPVHGRLSWYIDREAGGLL